MAKLVFKLQDASQGNGASIASTENGSGNGCDIIVSFDSRVVSESLVKSAFYTFAGTVTAG